MSAAAALWFWLSLGARPAALELPYLAKPPAIDGVLDPSLERIPEVALEAVGPAGPGAVRMRAAYGSRFLYLYVRSEQSGVRLRDRAYQNGDGLILVLATRQPGGGASRRFRVAGFSPQPESRRNWQFAFTWYRDVDLVMAPLEGARFAWNVRRGRAGFEILLPWQSLAPYHPWLGPDLGLNLCYVRARGDGSEAFFLTPDDRIQSEQSPRRYLPAVPAPPPAGSPAAWFGRLEQGHPVEGQDLVVELAEIATAGSASAVDVRVLAGEGEQVLRRRVEPSSRETGLRRTRAAFPARLPPGGYAVELGRGPEALRWGLSLLPAGGTARLRAELQRLAPGMARGTLSTMTFRVEEVERSLASLQTTDPAAGPRLAVESIGADLASLGRGVDPIAGATGRVRRAYRSRLDGTLQPYTVEIPEGVPPGERRPLLVFLHGSGQDDRGILDVPRAPRGWFQLAPAGRGTSNCFSADGAQDDIREAIDDVLAHLPVDRDRIVLAGFSMGGYGVYRTAHERPGFFRALAIFSGVPDLATRWLGPGHPDFLDPATHAVFEGSSMFVFHGTEDRNCPYEKTVALVERLEAAGAKVVFVTEEGKGHEAPSEATTARYFAWLEDVVR